MTRTTSLVKTDKIPGPQVNVYPKALNKDHQRMMVDPMFMIAQNFRSFLTAVTPTAVAQTAVIL